MSCHLNYGPNGSFVSYCTPPLMGFNNGGSVWISPTRRKRTRKPNVKSDANYMPTSEDVKAADKPKDIFEQD